MSSLQEKLAQYRVEHGIKQRQPGEPKVKPLSVWPWDKDIGEPGYSGHHGELLIMADEESAIKEKCRAEKRQPNWYESERLRVIASHRSFC